MKTESISTVWKRNQIIGDLEESRLGGTTQNEVMGVVIAPDHALRDAQGRAIHPLQKRLGGWGRSEAEPPDG
ncbi:hypothetical protein [Rubinisphaera italica]|nr:hypothetical protein [Rubinisphaera italica]